MKINNFTHLCQMVKGDTEALQVELLNDYTFNASDTVTMTVRKNANSDVAFTVTGAVIEEGSKHYANLNISSALTKNLKAGLYVYDIQLTMSGAIRTVVPISNFELIEEVTR